MSGAGIAWRLNEPLHDVTPRDPQISRTNQETAANLERLGLQTARELGGDDSVEQVEVLSTVDIDQRPAYHFALLVDLSRFKQRPGLVRIRLGQKLTGELRARGDDHEVILQMVDKADWHRRANAQTV